MRLVNLLLSTACVTGLVLAQDVRHDYDRSADFSKYRTYKWVKVESAVVPNQLMEQNIVKSIDEQLALKGLQKTEADTADLYVAYQASLDKEKQVDTWNTGGAGWGWGPGWGGYGAYGGTGLSQSTTSTINVGTLVVDMYDPARKQLVWRSSGTKTLNPGNNPDKTYKNLQKAVKKILKNYPPKPKN